MWKIYDNKIFLFVELIDYVMLRLKLFDVLIEIFKFLLDYKEIKC